MLLAIDAGNTTVHFGIFLGKKLVKDWREPTERITRNWSIRKRIPDIKQISKTIVSSVVPSINKAIRRQFPNALFVDHRSIGIRIKVKKPAEVGADRLVDALAAGRLYGGPAIIVDFGTATTFDVINGRGDYLGGAIAPGLLLARDTLYARTAKLPRVSLKAPRSVIGKNTVEAIRSGLVLGYAALVEGMVKRLRSQFSVPSSRIKVIATGGLAPLICKRTTVIDRIDPELTLKGLRLMGEKNERRA